MSCSLSCDWRQYIDALAGPPASCLRACLPAATVPAGPYMVTVHRALPDNVLERHVAAAGTYLGKADQS